MPSMTTVNCKTCKAQFEARTADVSRGWGKFCSKSCKATNQYSAKKKSKPARKSHIRAARPFDLSAMIERKISSHKLNMVQRDYDEKYYGETEHLHGDLDDDGSWGAHEH